MPVSFVYQKSAKKPRPDADACEIECKRHACAIQRCISRLRAYKSAQSGATLKFEACAEEISRYDACCERVKRAEAARTSEA